MAKVKRKKCCVCAELFTPQFTTFQKTCSTNCAIIYAKTKEVIKRQGLNKMRNEKVDSNKLETAINTTKKQFNTFIRERDKGKKCISCGCKWNPGFQAGHAYSAAKFNGIRFDFDCVHGQCFACNNLKEGNYDSYQLNLPGVIGKERAESLAKKARICKQIPHTWTRHELSEIRKEVIIRRTIFRSK